MDQQTITKLPKPDFGGKAGKAWRCKISDRKINAACGLWLIEAPDAHPFWQHYCFSLIHLREVPGLTDPIIRHMPLATHEIALYAVKIPVGDHHLLSFLNNAPNKEIQIMHPKNFAAQIVEIEDQLAIERCEKAIQEVCDGVLSPDEDYVWSWASRFGDNMIKK